jgi:hypothetical protein
VLVDRQRLGEVIRKVVYAGNMLHAELALMDSVLEPVETHIDTFGELRCEGPVSQTDSELVVAQNGRRGLGVAQVVQDAALFDDDFCGVKKTPVFSLLDRETYDGNALGAVGDGRVDEGGRVVTAQIIE